MTYEISPDTGKRLKVHATTEQQAAIKAVWEYRVSTPFYVRKLRKPPLISRTFHFVRGRRRGW